jgi:PAS domain S-box-containing protein
MVSSPCVLAVGTDDATRNLCARLERTHGVDLTAVADPWSAVDALSPGIDCVVGCADVVDAVGLAALEAIRERRPGLSIVVLHEDGEQAARALDAGVDRVVHLGDDLDSVAAELAAVIRHAPARREGPAVRRADGLLGDAIDTLTDVFFVFDLEGNFLHWNRRLPADTGYSDAAIAEMAPTDLIAPEDTSHVEAAIARVADEGQAQVEANFLTTDGERVPYEFTGALLTDDGGTPVAICGTGRDISHRKQRERALERQADRLETLNHINAVIRDVNEALVRASTREEIESAVCEHLVGDTPYRFAWIGDEGVTGDRVEPRAWAGVEEGYLDDRPSDPSGGVTARTALREDRVIVAQDIEDTPETACWRAAALERGYRSAAAIPLTYRDTTYGVLSVYAPRRHAFDETERAVLVELGETVAYAISAAAQRRALVTDTVVELTVGFPEESPFFAAAAAASGAEVSIEGVAEQSDGTLAEFVSVDGGDAEAVAELARERCGDASVITTYDDLAVLRVTPATPPLASLAADHGAVLRSGSATPDDAVATIELPREGDVRSVVSALGRHYPDTELRSQRERERTSTRGMEFRDSFDEALTDRQREVLETAFLAGYFDWPRASNAEDVADALGVSPPTFHEHVRRAERKLVDRFLDSAAAVPPSGHGSP